MQTQRKRAIIRSKYSHVIFNATMVNRHIHISRNVSFSITLISSQSFFVVSLPTSPLPLRSKFLGFISTDMLELCPF